MESSEGGLCNMPWTVPALHVDTISLVSVLGLQDISLPKCAD